MSQNYGQWQPDAGSQFDTRLATTHHPSHQSGQPIPLQRMPPQQHFPRHGVQHQLQTPVGQVSPRNDPWSPVHPLPLDHFTPQPGSEDSGRTLEHHSPPSVPHGYDSYEVPHGYDSCEQGPPHTPVPFDPNDCGDLRPHHSAPQPMKIQSFQLQNSCQSKQSHEVKNGYRSRISDLASSGDPKSNGYPAKNYHPINNGDLVDHDHSMNNGHSMNSGRFMNIDLGHLRKDEYQTNIIFNVEGGDEMMNNPSTVLDRFENQSQLLEQVPRLDTQPDILHSYSYPLSDMAANTQHTPPANSLGSRQSQRHHIDPSSRPSTSPIAVFPGILLTPSHSPPAQLVNIVTKAARSSSAANVPKNLRRSGRLSDLPARQNGKSGRHKKHAAVQNRPSSKVLSTSRNPKSKGGSASGRGRSKRKLLSAEDATIVVGVLEEESDKERDVDRAIELARSPLPLYEESALQSPHTRDVLPSVEKSPTPTFPNFEDPDPELLESAELSDLEWLTAHDWTSSTGPTESSGKNQINTAQVNFSEVHKYFNFEPRTEPSEPKEEEFQEHSGKINENLLLDENMPRYPYQAEASRVTFLPTPPPAQNLARPKPEPTTPVGPLPLGPAHTPASQPTIAAAAATHVPPTPTRPCWAVPVLKVMWGQTASDAFTPYCCNCLAGVQLPSNDEDSGVVCGTCGLFNHFI